MWSKNFFDHKDIQTVPKHFYKERTSNRLTEREFIEIFVVFTFVIIKCTLLKIKLGLPFSKFKNFIP